MQIYNWKKTSDFLQLLDYLQEAEDECIVSVGKRAVLGWFHIAFIKHLHPSKKIIFITKDDRLRKILKQSGYKHFSSIQEVYQYLPEGLQIMKENVSIPDYIRFHSSKFFSRFFGYIKYFKPKQPDIFEVKHSSWYVLMLGIVTILLLMIGIISLTSPHASVIITPQTSIQNAIRNVVFVPEDQLGAPEQIPLQKDIFSYEFTKTYRVNTFDPASLQRARGRVLIQNGSTETLRLKPQTRLVAGNLIFRTDEWIEIPPAQNSRPGKVTVTVVADPVGTDGVVMGKRGNIAENTSLIFPGLSPEIHENIAVIAAENFSGGDDSYLSLLTQEEYDRIKKIFEEQIITEAHKYKTKNYNKNADFIPLPIPDALSTLDITSEVNASVGDQVDEVVLTGKANFMVYLYHQPTLRKILLQTAESHLLEDTESLVEISNSPPDIIATLSKTEEPFSIKATAQIPVQILYDFSSPIGQKTLQNILSDLLDADAERAKKTLLNHPYIKTIDIRLTPFWSKKLPLTLDKIYIKIKKTDN